MQQPRAHIAPVCAPVPDLPRSSGGGVVQCCSILIMNGLSFQTNTNTNTISLQSFWVIVPHVTCAGFNRSVVVLDFRNRVQIKFLQRSKRICREEASESDWGKGPLNASRNMNIRGAVPSCTHANSFYWPRVLVKYHFNNCTITMSS